MINKKYIEEELLTNEEQSVVIKKQTAEIENLKFQITEYQQIVAELSAQLKEHKDTADFNRSFETDKK